MSTPPRNRASIPSHKRQRVGVKMAIAVGTAAFLVGLGFFYLSAYSSLMERQAQLATLERAVQREERQRERLRALVSQREDSGPIIAWAVSQKMIRAGDNLFLQTSREAPR